MTCNQQSNSLENTSSILFPCPMFSPEAFIWLFRGTYVIAQPTLCAALCPCSPHRKQPSLRTNRWSKICQFLDEYVRVNEINRSYGITKVRFFFILFRTFFSPASDRAPVFRLVHSNGFPDLTIQEPGDASISGIPRSVVLYEVNNEKERNRIRKPKELTNAISSCKSNPTISLDHRIAMGG